MQLQPLLALIPGLLGCAGDATDTNPGTDLPDTDTDVDTDTDTDTDVDTDTDADADTDTDTDVDTDTGDTGASPSGWTLLLEGYSPNCVVGWDVAPTPASYACPDCPYTLEWTFDAVYSQGVTDISGCGCLSYLDVKVVEAYFALPYQTQVLEQYSPVWAWTLDHDGSNERGLMGYAVGGVLHEGDLSAFPGTWDQVTGDFSFVDDPYYGLLRGYGSVP